MEIHIILTSINTSIREIKKTLDSSLILNKKYLDNFDSTLEKGTISFTADEQGFDFSTNKLYQLKSSWGEIPDTAGILRCDLILSDKFLCASPFITNNTVTLNSGIVDMGIIDFDNLTEAPEILSNTVFKIQSNHVYCFKTQEGKYAKVKANSQIDNYPITLDWVFQSDGSKILK